MASNGRLLKTALRLSAAVFNSNNTYAKSLAMAKCLNACVRLSSTSASNLRQILPKLKMNQASDIADLRLSEEDRTITIRFEDDTKGVLPILWLRDNCQCPKCFNQVALGRTFLLQDLDLQTRPTDLQFNAGRLQVTWSDGHVGTFDSNWLYQRAFSAKANESYRNLHRLPMEPWCKDLNLDKFIYEDLIMKDESLLQFLLTLESKGVTLIEGTPDDPDAGAKLIDHIAFVKKSHYGRRSPVLVRENTNNVAFSNLKLGLHNDLTQYSHQAGIIFIQTVKQHKGNGGESTISDGLYAAELLRKDHPEAFELLTKNNVYFWDKGTSNFDMEMDSFFKITKAPIIGLDCEGKVQMIRMNNQVRDSHMDLPADNVNSYYEAMKLFNDLLYEHSCNFKMNDGNILVMDNERCQHGREGYASSSSRHLESAYLDWDEALCKRRRLLEKMRYV